MDRPIVFWAIIFTILLSIMSSACTKQAKPHGLSMGEAYGEATLTTEERKE